MKIGSVVQIFDGGPNCFGTIVARDNGLYVARLRRRFRRKSDIVGWCSAKGERFHDPKAFFWFVNEASCRVVIS